MTTKDRERIVYPSSSHFFTRDAVLTKRPTGAYTITTVVDWGNNDELNSHMI